MYSVKSKMIGAVTLIDVNGGTPQFQKQGKRKQERKREKDACEGTTVIGVMPV